MQTTPETLTRAATPAIVVCEPQAHRNIASWSRKFADRGVQLIPHLKCHKTAQLASAQQAAGATSFLIAKPSELALWLDSNLDAPITQAWAFDRERVPPAVADLAGRYKTTITVDIDSIWLADAYDRAASSSGVQFDARVQVDLGLRGATPTDAIDLAHHIRRAKHLRLVALTGYRSIYGHDGGGRSTTFGDLGREEGALLGEVANNVGSDGQLNIVCGSTFTADGASTHPSVTHVAAGAYALGDWNMAHLGVMTMQDVALGVLCEVTEVSGEEMTVDIGEEFLRAKMDDLYPGVESPVFAATPDGAIVVSRLGARSSVATVRKGPRPAAGQRLLLLPGVIYGAVDGPGAIIAVNDDGLYNETWTRLATETTKDPQAVP